MAPQNFASEVNMTPEPHGQLGQFLEKHPWEYKGEQSSFKHLPRQRAIDKKSKDEIELMLKMKANEKLIQQHVNQRTGKSITSKDIHNMVERRDGGLTELIKEMTRFPGRQHALPLFCWVVLVPM